MAHDHDHDHASSGRGRIAVALGITAAILVAEVVGAVITGSLALLAWGDRWLSDGRGVPMILKHAPCSGTFAPKVVCAACRETIVPKDVVFRTNYAEDESGMEDARAA